MLAREPGRALLGRTVWTLRTGPGIRYDADLESIPSPHGRWPCLIHRFQRRAGCDHTGERLLREHWQRVAVALVPAGQKRRRRQRQPDERHEVSGKLRGRGERHVSVGFGALVGAAFAVQASVRERAKLHGLVCREGVGRTVDGRCAAKDCAAVHGLLRASIRANHELADLRF